MRPATLKKWSAGLPPIDRSKKCRRAADPWARDETLRRIIADADLTPRHRTTTYEEYVS